MTSSRAVWLAALLVMPALAVATAPAAAAPAVTFEWGSDLSQWWSFMDGPRQEAIQTSVANGMTIIGTDAKDAGPVGWSTPSYQTVTTFGAGGGGVERVVRDAHAHDIKVLARFDVFEDSVAAKLFPSTAIGAAWVDPACRQVRDHSLAQVRDLVTRVDVDELNLDHIRYPDTTELPASTRLPCTGGTLGDTRGVDRNAIITSWVKEAAAAARAIRPDIVVSISVFGWTMHDAMPTIGQDATAVAAHVDILRPMIYPSYYSKAAEGKPYDTVYESTALGVKKYGAAKVQPWIQGFGVYATKPEVVCQQLRALVDAGASGGMIWWFASTGTGSAFHEKARACLPATSPPPPTSTTPQVTFSPKKGNNWWVETDIRSNVPLASVSAIVNGKAPVTLDLKSWGSWTKSFHVSTNSVVRFVATTADGATFASAAHTWPDARALDPQPPALEVKFRKGGSNAWWVETWVSTNLPIASVSATIDGREVQLPLTSWGSYARSTYAPAGSTVVFTATSTDGQRAVSQPFAWP